MIHPKQTINNLLGVPDERAFKFTPDELREYRRKGRAMVFASLGEGMFLLNAFVWAIVGSPEFPRALGFATMGTAFWMIIVFGSLYQRDRLRGAAAKRRLSDELGP